MKKVRWFRVATSAVFVLCMAITIVAPAQTFTTLASFDGINGFNPFSGSLVQGNDGNYYGTTEFGGIGNCSFSNGCGTVFKISPSGTLKRLYSFCIQGDCASGNLPAVGLLLATDGNAYGTTPYGGSSGFPCSLGCGAIYEIAKGTVTTFYSFCAQLKCTDGGAPYAALIEGLDGNFYGTTSGFGPFGGGTVFEITPAGQLTTLYSFCQQGIGGCADGEYPLAGIVQGSNGDFYGTTYYGGANAWGTVFKVTPTGTLTTLHSFAGTPTEGGYPSAGLVQGADGNFYGTTLHGGISTCFEGCGTVFRITPEGVFSTLHTFEGPEGESPAAGLIQATDVNFYGTTIGGGNNGAGTLYSFCAQPSCADGSGPWGGLLQATSGTLYGTTYGGGNLSCQGCGTVFSLDMGLGPFVETLPTIGKVGAAIRILGTDLTGATSVTFNGTAATFTIVSPTEIKTTVPTGATTGKVQVTTPDGTLTSNVAFRVK
jgi:uncharacterized repeat protein (TIGR03803 family)